MPWCWCKESSRQPNAKSATCTQNLWLPVFQSTAVFQINHLNCLSLINQGFATYGQSFSVDCTFPSQRNRNCNELNCSMSLCLICFNKVYIRVATSSKWDCLLLARDDVTSAWTVVQPHFNYYMEMWFFAGQRDAAAFLYKIGLQGKVVQRIVTRHASKTKEEVTKDPYYAMRSIKGMNLR